MARISALFQAIAERVRRASHSAVCTCDAYGKLTGCGILTIQEEDIAMTESSAINQR